VKRRRRYAVLSVPGAAQQSVSWQAESVQPMTVSEELFEKLCRNSQVRFEPIPAADGVRTADYKVWLNTVEAIVEVKQIKEGNHERNLLATAENDEAPAVASDVHIRIRKKFQKARKQLKNLSGGFLPTLFVLYDNTNGLSGLDNEDFLQAMHGNEVLEIYSTKSGKPPKVVGTFHTFDSGSSKVREYLNTSVSCFCRLLANKDGNPMLYVFHNEFAANPLSTDLAKLIANKQFVRPKTERNEYRNWMPI